MQVGQIANSLVFDADGAPLLVLTSETRTASEAPLRTLVDRDLERYVRGVGC